MFHAVYNFLIKKINGNGFSFLSIVGASILISFSIVYKSFGTCENETTGFLEAIPFSARYMLTLTDSYESCNNAMSSVGVVESTCGTLFFAIIIAVISNKLVRTK